MQPNDFPVRLPIKLGQFLKLANLVEDGASARLAIQNQFVTVNQDLETRRGRTLKHQDLVTLTYPDGNQTSLRVVAEQD